MARLDIGNLMSEARNDRTKDMDRMSVQELLAVMNEEDGKVAEAVGRELPAIEQAIGLAVKALRAGGHIFYLGAGTSGRIGVMDAVECAPTFGCTDEFQAILAGGEGAFVKAREGAEDDEEAAVSDLKQHGVAGRDLVIGIAASGRTPYTIAALRYARSIGCSTVAIANNKGSELGREADVAIEAMTGPEVLTGSTRLKAASAQKMICNMISTITMQQMGKTYENLMVDMRPTNEKLYDRAGRIVTEATGCLPEQAEEALVQCGYHTKTAIVMLLCGLSAAEANRRLSQAGGVVARACGAQAASGGGK